MKRLITILIFLVLILITFQLAESKCKGKKEIKKANLLYFENKFEEALEHFLNAYDRGCQDGVTKYKMFYCYMTLGNKEKEEQFLKSALTSLEKESSDKPTHGIYFYLANAYFSSNMKKQGIEVSKQAIEKYEQGKFDKLKNSVSFFQLGKIYLDADQKEKALDLYRKSYESSRKRNDLPKAYLKRILIEIAYADYAEKEYNKASEEFSHLIEIEPKLIEEGPRYRNLYLYLAISFINIGQYEKSEKAWKKMIQLGLPHNEQAQYNHRIARAAIEESSDWIEVEKPSSDRKSKDSIKDEDKFKQQKHDSLVAQFKELDNEKLEAALVEISKEAKDLKKEATLKSEEKETQDFMDKELINKKLKELRKSFVFACVEYISRSLPIRESAIQNGFAVQIMRKDAWEIH